MKIKKHLGLFALCLLVAGFYQYGRMPVETVGASPFPETPLGGPVVLELFTSQSCSSCPPADAYLEQLAHQPHIIALSCHVTYWNHLSWQDTISREFCTERQHAYTATRGGEHVFTPELVVNGHLGMVGSKAYFIKQALAAENNKILPVAISGNGQDGFTVSLPDLPKIDDSKNLIVSLLFYGPDQTVPIGRGENSGRTVTYTHPVMEIREIKNHWNGQAQTVSLSRDDFPADAAGFAAIAQYEAGEIVAAGKMRSTNPPIASGGN